MDLSYMLDMTSYSLHRHIAATILTANKWQDLGSLSFKKNGKITLGGDYWEIVPTGTKDVNYYAYNDFLHEASRFDPEFKVDSNLVEFEEFLSVKKTTIHRIVAHKKLTDLGWCRGEFADNYINDRQFVYLHEDGFWYKHPNEGALFYPYNMFKTIIF